MNVRAWHLLSTSLITVSNQRQQINAPALKESVVCRHLSISPRNSVFLYEIQWWQPLPGQADLIILGMIWEQTQADGGFFQPKRNETLPTSWDPRTVFRGRDAAAGSCRAPIPALPVWSESPLFNYSASRETRSGKTGRCISGSGTVERDGIPSPGSKAGRPLGCTSRGWSRPVLMNTREAKKKWEKINPLSLSHHSTKGLFLNSRFKSTVSPWGQLLNFERSSGSSKVEHGGSFTCSIRRKF